MCLLCLCLLLKGFQHNGPPDPLRTEDKGTGGGRIRLKEGGQNKEVIAQHQASRTEVGGAFLKGGISCICWGFCPPSFCFSASDSQNRGMHRPGVPGGARALDLDLFLSRSSVLLLGCVFATAGLLRAEVEVLVEAGEGGGLEASMHSSFLQDFQEAPEGFRTEDAQPVPAVPGSLWDAAAVVGRLFQVKLPQQVDDVVKVSLHVCSPTCTLEVT